MGQAGHRWSEEDRLAAIRRYGILDSPAQADLEDVVQIAAHVCAAPFAAVSLVEEHRQWFAARVGFSMQEMPIEASICKVALDQPSLLVVPDLAEDARFRANPLVVGDPLLRFYAGAVLKTPDGFPLGTVCVLDHEARDLTEEQATTLRALARQVMAQLELRRSVENTRRYAEQLQALGSAALRITAAGALEPTMTEVTEAARNIIGCHQSVVSLTRGPDWSQAINTVSLSEKYERYRTYSAVPDGSGVYALVCEANAPMRLKQSELEDHPRWRGFGPYAGDHPPLRGWLAAPLVGHDGRNVGVIQVSDKLDATEFGEGDEAVLVQLAQLASVAVERAASEEQRRKAEERQKFFSRELHHRLKNSLATVQAILGSTARSARSVQDFYTGFTRRVTSLARTHDLLSEELWQVTSLRGLLEAEIAPYREADVERIRLDGPDVVLRSEVAVPLGMGIHELTSNAAMHGSLSAPGGRIRVQWHVSEPDNTLYLEWVEERGPPVQQPVQEGFGTRILRRVLPTQTRGETSLNYDPKGLRVNLKIPLDPEPQVQPHPLQV